MFSFHFKCAILLLIIITTLNRVACEEDDGKVNVNIWPIPTCDDNRLNKCEIKTAHQLTPGDFVFHQGSHDATTYTKITFTNECELIVLPNNFFTVFENVQEVTVRGVRLEHIGLNIFENGGKLKTIDLTYNNLTVIEGLSFEGANNINTLNLQMNKIQTIDQQAFTNLSQLHVLSIYRNNIEHLADNVLPESLEELYMSHNLLTNIDFIVDLVNVEKLDFSHNKITQITNMQIFSKLERLQRLEFTANKLIHFDLDNFEPPNLKQLYVEANQLTSLSLEGLQKMKRFEQLRIQDNKWTCEQLSKIIIAIGSKKIKTHNKMYAEQNINGIKCYCQSWIENVSDPVNQTVNLVRTDDHV